MKETTFKERVARLEKIGAALEKLPAEVRSQAFDLLKSYAGIEERPAQNVPVSHGNRREADKVPRDDGGENKEQFFSAFDHDKPADNVKLVAAYLFGQYGSQPFQADDIQAIADEVGITVPNRIDMTIRQATAAGKKLFTSAGRGLFKPTVHGEAYLKSEYKVKKGTRPKPAQPDS